MRWEQIDSEDGYHPMRVEAAWEEIAADYDDIVSAYAKVRVPGFRPGKVPRSMIEQRLQKQILDDLSHRAAQRLSREALLDAGVKPMGPIEIGDIECGKGKPFRFIARFWPIPEIELPDLESLAIGDDVSDPRDVISRRLLELMNFAVPDELVRAELGADENDRGKESIAWKAATDRVRLMLILKTIAAKEGIEVSEADVEQRIKEKAIEFGSTHDALRSELEKGGGRQRLKDMLLAESTMDYLVERGN